jgi:hypothetical protein
MKWTREPPREDGYYWFRWDGVPVPTVVRVYRGDVKIHDEWWRPDEARGEWAGPLVPPGEGGHHDS